MKKENERTIRKMEVAISRIKNFKDTFVAYNTRFLGLSPTDNFVINGENTRDDKPINEFCFGYDDDGNLQILNVFKTKEGVKYAATELLMSLYGYWLILE